MNSSGAVRLGSALYRINEVAWLKVQRTTIWEKLTNALLILSGIAFVMAMHTCKGTWYSLEALLGLLPICLGLSIHGDARLASSGDTQDSYFGRGLGLDVNLKELARPLRDAGVSFLELSGSRNAYYYLINTDRLAWVSSWFTCNTWPLWMAILFFGYKWVLDNHLHVGTLPSPFNSLHILEFANADSLGSLTFSTVMCAVAGILALAASIKTGVILGAVGGVADTLHMYRSDRTRLLDIVAGQPTAATQPVVPVAVPPVEAAPPPAPVS